LVWLYPAYDYCKICKSRHCKHSEKQLRFLRVDYFNKIALVKPKKMKRVILKFSLSFIITTCVFAACNAAHFLSFPIPPSIPDDSITITGKVIAPCYIPEKVKIWRYSVWDVMIGGDEVPVNKNGEFSYRAAISGPQQFVLRDNQTKCEFIATPSEKIYNIEISCTNGIKITVQNSYENNAFSQLSELSLALYDSLKEISKSNVENKATFEKLKSTFLEYQVKVAAIAQNYPNSFTAQVLCPFQKLPEQSFSSINELRNTFLEKNIFSNRLLYNTNAITSWALPEYFLLLDKNDTTFIGFNKALNIACRNQETGKLFEQLLYGATYYQHKESPLRGYINWAKLNPDKMYNQVVKAQLKNISGCIAGSPYIELTMNDPNGVTRKLSETVASAKLTLLIFYSPTCSHCQETLPKIVPIWNQFKSKGLKIYTAGFEATTEEWVDFIKTKGTSEWTNVFDYDHGKNSSWKYYTTNTPTMLLIDQHGKIITRFADFEYLQTEIPKYFGQ